MSFREDKISEFMEFCSKNGLNQSYGCLDGISDDRKYRYCTFARARSIDGEFKVYGPKFMVVSWQTQYSTLPHRGTEVFDSFDNVLKFLNAAFVDPNKHELDPYEYVRK